jgi:two-component system OmpR family sensor kinase
MDMGTKLKNSFNEALRKCAEILTWPGRERIALKAGEVGGSTGSNPAHILALLTAAVLFFGFELLIEQWLFDNDTAVDVLGAVVGVLALVWVRYAIINARLQKKLRQSLEDRAQKFELQSKFLTEVAHEFQTPLAILKGNIAILAQIPERKILKRNVRADDEYAAAADTATATLDRLSRLVKNILDIGKLNFSKKEFPKAPVDMGELLHEVRDDFALLAEDKKIEFLLSIQAPLETSLLVIGDADKLKEVVLNLLSNALKYTPAGGTITLGVNRLNHDTRDEIEITVTDTGCGIAAEDLPNIFERYYRIPDQRGGSNPSGNGLGLHICRQIVEAHGGAMAVQSEPGRGSRFSVRLPARRGTENSLVL